MKHALVLLPLLLGCAASEPPVAEEPHLPPPPPALPMAQCQMTFDITGMT
ncbi:MAG: hypothetical protein R3B72_35340 [Polyangiaceae bacterium]